MVVIFLLIVYEINVLILRHVRNHCKHTLVQLFQGEYATGRFRTCGFCLFIRDGVTFVTA